MTFPWPNSIIPWPKFPLWLIKKCNMQIIHNFLHKILCEMDLMSLSTFCIKIAGVFWLLFSDFHDFWNTLKRIPHFTRPWNNYFKFHDFKIFHNLFKPCRFNGIACQEHNILPKTASSLNHTLTEKSNRKNTYLKVLHTREYSNKVSSFRKLPWVSMYWDRIQACVGRPGPLHLKSLFHQSDQV